MTAKYMNKEYYLSVIKTIW